MDYTKEQFEKLPKWAQSELQRLQKLAKTLSKSLSEFNGESETNTYLIDGLEEKPLVNNAVIQFCTGPNKLNRVTIRVLHDGAIDVNSDSRISQELAILPRAANSCYLTFIER